MRSSNRHWWPQLAPLLLVAVAGVAAARAADPQTPQGKMSSDGHWLEPRVDDMPHLPMGPFVRLEDGGILTVDGVNALMLVGNKFEERLEALARERGHDGVICGHYHKAALHHRDGLVYANCGDWVDNQTALVETADGSLQMLAWSGETQSVELWTPAAERSRRA